MRKKQQTGSAKTSVDEKPVSQASETQPTSAENESQVEPRSKLQEDIETLMNHAGTLTKEPKHRVALTVHMEDGEFDLGQHLFTQTEIDSQVQKAWREGVTGYSGGKNVFYPPHVLKKITVVLIENQ